MGHVLVIYYSQSGEVARATMAFTNELEAGGHQITLAPIRPIATYPYPWRSVRRFFDVMPESIMGVPPPIRPPDFDPETRYDLVVLAYPVWFLSPAPAMQAFFRTPAAAVLRGADVLTITVARAMWHRASEITKGLLSTAGARHVDNVVLTHQGSPLATLVSTPRTLLLGKRDRLLGLFPEAGASAGDFDRVRRLGAVAGMALASGRTPGASLLAGEQAVDVVQWLVVPELVAARIFRGWALAILRLERIHPGLRVAGVYGFVVSLVLMILLLLPAVLLATLSLRPFVGANIRARASRLAAPTGAVGSGGINRPSMEK